MERSYRLPEWDTTATWSKISGMTKSLLAEASKLSVSERIEDENPDAGSSWEEVRARLES
jgi:hypothetical protein